MFSVIVCFFCLVVPMNTESSWDHFSLEKQGLFKGTKRRFARFFPVQNKVLEVMKSSEYRSASRLEKEQPLGAEDGVGWFVWLYECLSLVECFSVFIYFHYGHKRDGKKKTLVFWNHLENLGNWGNQRYFLMFFHFRHFGRHQILAAKIFQPVALVWLRFALALERFSPLLQPKARDVWSWKNPHSFDGFSKGNYNQRINYKKVHGIGVVPKLQLYMRFFCLWKRIWGFPWYTQQPNFLEQLSWNSFCLVSSWRVWDLNPGIWRWSNPPPPCRFAVFSSFCSVVWWEVFFLHSWVSWVLKTVFFPEFFATLMFWFRLYRTIETQHAFLKSCWTR